MKKIIPLLFVCFGLLFGGPSFVSATESPTGDLKPILNDLTSVLQNKALKGKEHKVERRQKIMSQIKRGFDFEEMSKRVLGKTWRKIDEAEKDRFTGLMTKLLENVYIGKLEGYSGQVLEFAGEKVKGNRAQVTTFLTHKGVKIPIHYIMSKKDPNWMVYDINIEGVSLIKNYRAQFKGILRERKYQGLVKQIEKMNQSFEK